MKFKNSGIILFFLLLLYIFSIGCENINNINIDEIEMSPTSGLIIIQDGAESIIDCTPLLIIYSERADYMSFSGDGESWSEWVEYSTFYNEFNIASGLNGTERSSGIKYVYVRFKNDEGNLSSENEIAFDTIEYELGELHSIKIFPEKISIPVDSNHVFTLHGYDLMVNEVPLDSSKVCWTKCCGVGSLSNDVGLSTTYTVPCTPGKRDITAQYGNFQKTGAIIMVISDN